MGKLGLIAGGGNLPIELARASITTGRLVFVVRLAGMADAGLLAFPGAEIPFPQFGAMFEHLRAEGCDEVCLIGQVPRPDFAAMRPDEGGKAVIAAMAKASSDGDDAVLRALVRSFEDAGFRVRAAQEIAAGLMLSAGPAGAITPRDENMADIERALMVAREIGRYDIGQGAVVVRGLVLAVEAQEGTDAMLKRCAQLPAHLRGDPGARAGVLAKAPKPIQDERVDFPTMGLATIRGAAAAGLAGVAGVAGGLLLLDRDEAIAEADRLGLFIYGLSRTDA